MLGHTLVHALVAAANQQQAGGLGQAVGHGLAEEASLGREQHYLSIRTALRPDGFHGVEDGLRFEHHALAAAEGTVVDGLVTVHGPVAQIVNADVEQLGVLRALHHAVRERPLKELGEDRQHMKRHGRFTSFKPSGRSTPMRRRAGSISTQMARAKGISSPPASSSKPAPPASCQAATRPSDSPERRSTTSHPMRSDWKNSPSSSGTRWLSGTRSSAPRSGSASEMVSMPRNFRIRVRSWNQDYSTSTGCSAPLEVYRCAWRRLWKRSGFPLRGMAVTSPRIPRALPRTATVTQPESASITPGFPA